MNGKKLLLMLVAGALLLLQFSDCMAAMASDQQNMHCCGSMPCTPANQSHDCCKTMVSVHTPNVLPTARVSLNAPAVVAVEHTTTLEIVRSATASPLAFAVQQHSPPELYTLHASLLI